MTVTDPPTLPLLQLRVLAASGDVADLGPVVEVTGFNRERTLPRELPIIVLATEDPDASEQPSPDVDLFVEEGDREHVLPVIRANPRAAVVLAQLLRTSETMDVPSALMAESLAFSMLQSGPEFAAWLANRPADAPRPDPEPVLVETHGGRTVITLNRPRSANAVDRLLRHELFAAISALALSDGPIALRGEGNHFCSGGDLREFGMAKDPVTAHLTRTTQLLPGAIARVSSRLTAHVHGACVGAGAELSSFASRVVAAEGTRWRLPEVTMGLIPGAGGTVSVPRRIGRHRALKLALDPRGVDVATALAWGLVDAVER